MSESLTRFENAIRTAIRDKKRVKMVYDGKGERIVCPHIYYLDGSGRKYVDCYQIAGFAENTLEILKMIGFEEEKITLWEILENRFSPTGLYNPNNVWRYHKVLASV